jgi:hypothetical protein
MKRLNEKTRNAANKKFSVWSSQNRHSKKVANKYQRNKKVDKNEDYLQMSRAGYLLSLLGK